MSDLEIVWEGLPEAVGLPGSTSGPTEGFHRFSRVLTLTEMKRLCDAAESVVSAHKQAVCLAEKAGVK